MHTSKLSLACKSYLVILPPLPPIHQNVDPKKKNTTFNFGLRIFYNSPQDKNIRTYIQNIWHVCKNHVIMFNSLVLVSRPIPLILFVYKRYKNYHVTNTYSFNVCHRFVLQPVFPSFSFLNAILCLLHIEQMCNKFIVFINRLY